ncbi:uncharacterized protein LOC141910620 [Tubulanus polymorphus]|uniref:uncharacterized protein LOC141910620 n=1 Tax=Tubulanus polymorphus TaxID=672921 RepID=UPI003DA4D16A
MALRCTLRDGFMKMRSFYFQSTSRFCQFAARTEPQFEHQIDDCRESEEEASTAATTKSALEGVSVKEFTFFTWELLKNGITDIDSVVDQITQQFGTESELRWRKVCLPFRGELLKRKILDVLAYDGTTLPQILQTPEILLRSESYLAKKSRWLKLNGFPSTTVAGLIYAGGKRFEQMREIGAAQTDSWLDVLARKLECSVEELLNDLAANASKLRPYNLRRIVERIDLLIANGADGKMIREQPFVLSRSTATLRRRIERLDSLGLRKPRLPITWLIQNDREFDQIVEGHLRLRDAMADCADKWEYLAKLLDVGESQVKKAFPDFDLTLITKKIRFLFAMGFTGEQILLYPRVLHPSLEGLRLADEYFRANEISNLRLPQIYAFASNRRVHLKRNASYTRRSIARILETNLASLDKYWPHLQPAISFTERELCANKNVLLKHGFELSDVSRCPLLFNHVPEALERYLAKLESLKTVAPFSNWSKRNKSIKLLNALQYLIEKDLNFSEIGFRASHEDDSTHSGSSDQLTHSGSSDQSIHSGSSDQSDHSGSSDQSDHSGSIDHLTHSGSIDRSTHSGSFDQSTHSGSIDRSTHSGSFDQSTHSGSIIQLTHNGSNDQSTHSGPDLDQESNKHVIEDET